MAITALTRRSQTMIILVVGLCVFTRSAALAWPDDPAVNVPVCLAPDGQIIPDIVADGEGGWITVWMDYRSGGWDIYAQRLDSHGVPQWTPNGVAICVAPNEQQYVKIAADHQGGAVITWQDGRNIIGGNNNYDIYAQRVDASGAPLWTPNGVAVCGAVKMQLGPVIVADDAGVIIAWDDARANIPVVYAQRLSMDGAPCGRPTG